MQRLAYEKVVNQLIHENPRFAIDEVDINGISTKVWRSAFESLRVVLERSYQYGNATYLVYENERISYEQHYQLVCSLAHTLVSDFDVQPGDRVALAMRNLPEWPVIFWATVSIGAIIVPLNAWWETTELAYAIKDSAPKVLFVDAQRWQKLSSILSELTSTQLVVTRSDEIHTPPLQYESLINNHFDKTALPARSLHPDHAATLFYTSGTTGLPKGALGTHRNICNNLISSAFHKTVAQIRRGDTAQPTPATGHLLSVPLFHATGCHAMLCGNTLSGNKLVFMYKWNAEEAIRLIESERLSSFGGVPSMVWQVIESPEFKSHDLSTVNQIMYGGAPAAPELAKRIHKLFPQVQSSNGYGLTETSALATSNQAEDYLETPDSVGKPAPVTQVKVVDELGQQVPTGEIGELWIKGPNVILGYWNNPEATTESFTQGWLHTGDLARMDDEGRIYIMDRAKDMIIRGGENVYCVEVENVLYSHPEIMDAAVIGIPDKILGEEVGAIVQLIPNSQLTETEIIQYTEGKLAPFKRPVRVNITRAPLPRNANGKILKKQLKMN